MSSNQTAGRSIVNLNVEGNDNRIVVVADQAALEAEFENIAADRKYKILVCIPSYTKARHRWHDFAESLSKALEAKGFEIVIGGSNVPRNPDELIYLAEHRHLTDRNCHALLILACDHVTISQLTHLTHAAFCRQQLRKDIVVVSDNSIVEGEQYFQEGALKPISEFGMVMPLNQGDVPTDDLIQEIVRRFVLLRNVIR